MEKKQGRQPKPPKQPKPHNKKGEKEENKKMKRSFHHSRTHSHNRMNPRSVETLSVNLSAQLSKQQSLHSRVSAEPLHAVKDKFETTQETKQDDTISEESYHEDNLNSPMHRGAESKKRERMKGVGDGERKERNRYGPESDLSTNSPHKTLSNTQHTLSPPPQHSQVFSFQNNTLQQHSPSNHTLSIHNTSSHSRIHPQQQQQEQQLPQFDSFDSTHSLDSFHSQSDSSQGIVFNNPILNVDMDFIFSKVKEKLELFQGELHSSVENLM